MNRTYENCKLLITAGRYTYEDMFNKLDLFLMMGRVTEAEYVELTGLPVEPPAETPAEESETPVEGTV